MSSNWPTVTIQELIDDGVILVHKDGNHGSNYPRTAEFGEEGIPFLTAKLLDDSGNIDFDSAPRLSTDKANKFKFGFLEPNDVLLSHNATVGRVAVVPAIKERMLIGTSLTHYRLDSSRLLPKYLAAYFSGIAFQNQLASVMSQTTRNQVPITSQRKLSVVVPPIEDQKIIADMLGAFDDKIQNNTQTNQTLEQIAQAIFKSWFVDFDPVKAKIETLATGGSTDDAELAAMGVISAKTLDELNSLKASNPEAFNKLAQTATLFPAAMQDSELGEIPVGWEVKQLKDILELAYGKALKKTDRVDGDVPVYGSGGLTGYHNQSLVEGPGIIVGRKGTVGSVYWEPKAFYPIDTVFYVKPRAGYSLKYCHLVLQNLGLKDMNTDAAVPGLNRDNAYRLDVITPTKDVMNLFKEIMQTLQSNVDANNAQSVSLESLRDTLLPKLLSGEIDLTSEVTA
ncbi:restriction endonuclease subunit S [Vibrio cholerae]|nr:restriction endonuclease subunit S [Vibrio cholerae]ELG5191930.1 restriction endonuclease subunit S [Vibrio cholerae]GHZ81209.1 restriction endonuclease subunit S [Vibrio cholerae]